MLYQVSTQCCVCQAPATVVVVPEGFKGPDDGISACAVCGVRMQATLQRVALAQAVQRERVRVPTPALVALPEYRVAIA